MSYGGEIDGEEEARVARAVAEAAAVTVKALAAVTMIPGSPHKRFVREMGRLIAAQGAQALSEAQRVKVMRLAWRFRRQMPRHLAGWLNPDDPVVRETIHG